jgi:hypothetical protein
MATIASIGYGATLKFGATLVGQVVDIDWSMSCGKDLVSNQGSPSNAAGGFWVEKIPTASDAGSLTFNVIYNAAQMAALFVLMGATQTWKLTFPDTHFLTSSGFITDIKKGTPLETHETIDITIECTGALVYT